MPLELNELRDLCRSIGSFKQLLVLLVYLVWRLMQRWETPACLTRTFQTLECERDFEQPRSIVWNQSRHSMLWWPIWNPLIKHGMLCLFCLCDCGWLVWSLLRYLCLFKCSILVESSRLATLAMVKSRRCSAAEVQFEPSLGLVQLRWTQQAWRAWSRGQRHARSTVGCVGSVGSVGYKVIKPYDGHAIVLFFGRGALACSWTLKVESRVRTQGFLNVCSSHMIVIQVPISCMTFIEPKSFKSFFGTWTFRPSDRFEMWCTFRPSLPVRHCSCLWLM